MEAIDKFNEIFSAVSIRIPFNPRWDNGTGYYVLNRMPAISADVCVKVVNSDGRKLIIFGTDYGPAVVFQRDKTGDRQSRVCCNLPEEYVYELDRSWTGEFSCEELSVLAGTLDL